MTLVDFANADSPNASEALEYELFLMGYSRPDEGGMMGLEKFTSRGDGAVANLIIEHLAADGTTIVDAWILKGAFIISATYNKLEYSSDDLSEITLEIAYDYAHYGEIAGSSDNTPSAKTRRSN